MTLALASERRTQAQRTAATRGRLLDATIDALVERGYAGASTTEICRRAGVSRGAQLHHFPTKALLVAAAVERLFDMRHREFRELTGDSNRADRVDRAFDALWTIYSGPTLCAWMELVVAARTDPVLAEHVAAVDERFIEQAQHTFRQLFDGPGAQGIDVAAATRLVLSTLDGLALHYVVNRDTAEIQRVFEVFKGLISDWLQ